MALTKTGLTFVNGSAPAFNGDNLNSIVDLTDDIVDYVETPSYASETDETKEIISLPSTVIQSKFDATVKGNTVVNLLDDDVAGCESTSGWTALSVTLTTNADKYEGTYSLSNQLTATTGGAYYGVDIDNSKYYLATAFMKIVDCTDARLRIMDSSNNFVADSTPITSTTWSRVGVVLQPSDLTGLTQIRLYLRGTGAIGEIYRFDALQLQAISSTEYALGASALLEQKSYHRGTKSTDKSRVLSVGKNIQSSESQKWEQGSISTVDGSNAVNTTRLRTKGFEKINGGSTISTSVESGYDIFYKYFYDKNYNFISFTSSDINIPIPTNASYYRLILRFTNDTTITLTDLENAQVNINYGSTATTYEPYTQTQATCPTILHSVPAIQDTWEIDTGKITDNVKEYTTITSNITGLITTPTNVDYVTISKPTDFIGYNSTSTVYDNAILSAGYRQYTGGGYDDASKVGVLGSSGGATTFVLVVAKGTYANLAAAQAALAGTVIYYQLAEPITTYTQPAIVNAEPNGTVYVEPYIPESETAQFYSSGLTLDSNYPLSSLNDIDEINKYDLTTGIITPIDIADLTLASSTSITISGASDGEFYAASYNYRFESTIPTVTHKHGLNIKAQTNDNTDNIKLLDKKINDVKIDNLKQEELASRIFISQIYGTRWL